MDTLVTITVLGAAASASFLLALLASWLFLKGLLNWLLVGR
jgi:hypothetical protein